MAPGSRPARVAQPPHLRGRVAGAGQQGHRRRYEKFGILTKRELEARRDIAYEQYVKAVNVEANIVIELARTKIFPAAFRYETELAHNVAALKAAASIRRPTCSTP